MASSTFFCLKNRYSLLLKTMEIRYCLKVFVYFLFCYFLIFYRYITNFCEIANAFEVKLHVKEFTNFNSIPNPVSANALLLNFENYQ